MKRYGNLIFYALVLVLWCFVSWVEGHAVTVNPMSLWIDGALVGFYVHHTIDCLGKAIDG